MNWIEITGHFGSLLSSITFMPQVYRIYKTKSVDDLSMAMLLIVFTSTLVWLTYGIFNNPRLWPVIICNSVICFLSIMLIYFKIAYSSTKKKG